jgi:AraC-like DNA-binding protein
MAASPRVSEWTKYFHYDDQRGIAALHAQFISHRYPRHSHDYFVIGLVESGVQSYTYRGKRHITPAGNIFVVNPDEIHTGEAASEYGYIYRTLCLSTEFVTTLTRELGSKASCLFLRGAVLIEPELAIVLRKFHKSLSTHQPRIESDTLLFEAVSLLFGRHGDAPRGVRPAFDESPAVGRVREYIEENFDEDLSLARLASLCSLSPFSLVRRFKKATGLPPHTYLDGVRLRHARQLLNRGESIASVAVSVGYADQSHLTKRFKKLYGITPGRYQSRN